MQNCGIRESGARQGSPTRCRHERRHRCAHTDEELHRLWDGVLAHRGHDVADMIVLRPSRLVTRDGDSGGYGGVVTAAMPMAEMAAVSAVVMAARRT